MRAGFTIDQLHVDLCPVAHPPNAAFKNVTDAEVTTDLLRVDGFPLVGKGRVTGDYEAVRDPREIGRQIIRYRVRKIFLVRIGR